MGSGCSRRQDYVSHSCGIGPFASTGYCNTFLWELFALIGYCNTLLWDQVVHLGRILYHILMGSGCLSWHFYKTYLWDRVIHLGNVMYYTLMGSGRLPRQLHEILLWDRVVRLGRIVRNILQKAIVSVIFPDLSCDDLSGGDHIICTPFEEVTDI